MNNSEIIIPPKLSRKRKLVYSCDGSINFKRIKRRQNRKPLLMCRLKDDIICNDAVDGNKLYDSIMATLTPSEVQYIETTLKLNNRTFAFSGGCLAYFTGRINAYKDVDVFVYNNLPYKSLGDNRQELMPYVRPLLALGYFKKPSNDYEESSSVGKESVSLNIYQHSTLRMEVIFVRFIDDRGHSDEYSKLTPENFAIKLISRFDNTIIRQAVSNNKQYVNFPFPVDSRWSNKSRRDKYKNRIINYGSPTSLFNLAYIHVKEIKDAAKLVKKCFKNTPIYRDEILDEKDEDDDDNDKNNNTDMSYQDLLSS